MFNSCFIEEATQELSTGWHRVTPGNAEHSVPWIFYVPKDNFVFVWFSWHNRKYSVIKVHKALQLYQEIACLSKTSAYSKLFIFEYIWIILSRFNKSATNPSMLSRRSCSFVIALIFLRCFQASQGCDNICSMWTSPYRILRKANIEFSG